MDIHDCASVIVYEQNQGSPELFQYFGIFNSANIVDCEKIIIYSYK